MIKCKVTKKIMQEPGTVMGFSIGQVVMLIMGCIATIGTLLLLWLVLKINIDIIMWVVFLISIHALVKRATDYRYPIFHY